MCRLAPDRVLVIEPCGAHDQAGTQAKEAIAVDAYIEIALTDERFGPVRVLNTKAAKLGRFDNS